MDTPSWPILQTFDQAHLGRIALPVGGIGTGTVSLGGRGDLRDWELANRPAKGYTPQAEGVSPCFALYARDAANRTHVRLLEGPVDLSEYEGALGAVARNHGFPRFRHCAFRAACPFGQVLLSGPELPVKAVIKAFNPLIPGDVAGSSYPAAIFRIEVTNLTAGPLDTSVCWSVPNFIGEDGAASGTDGNGGAGAAGARANRNRVHRTASLAGVHLTAPALSPAAEQYGDLYLATPAGQDITWRTAWADLTWGDSKLEFWEDFSADGRVTEQTSRADKPIASLCVSHGLAPRATHSFTFLLTWRFPNRASWSRFDGAGPVIIGNHYATCFADAPDAAERLHGELGRLEQQTLAFVRAVCASSLPAPVRRAALFNLSTLRTQTCFRTPDGKFYGWEGCHDHAGSCPGNCNHVWNYEQATAFLFGELAHSMRRVEFQHATDARGRMDFRVDLPLDRPPAESACKHVAAADGQMGCLLKLYRDWQLSGDDALLRALYPHAKRALEFCWIPGGWDADRDGLMEGCQHNTMDVEYFGPNPQMGFWYLGALRAMQAMASYLGDAAFAGQCRRLFRAGSRALDRRLFNGEYYEHLIVPPRDAGRIAAGLRLDLGSKDLVNPVFQLGSGCLVDQLVGQFTAHLLGLGYLSDPARQRQALDSIFRYNFQQGFHHHFNHHRSYVLGDESGVLMATYPHGRRPARPFPYFNEVMTGFEYVLAAHLFYEGRTAAGLAIVRAIRERFDGQKRNPFDEAECGHHYARAMASWSALLALTGFRYSGVTRRMAFRAADGVYFWSNGAAWGDCAIAGRQVTLRVLRGTLPLREFALTGTGRKRWRATQTLTAPAVVRLVCGPAAAPAGRPAPRRLPRAVAAGRRWSGAHARPAAAAQG